MKRPTFYLALLACGTALLQAAELYDITLSNAQKYTNCRISYQGSSKTKFTGTDKNGKVVTKEVKTSSILLKKAVEQKTPEPEETPEQPATTEATTPAEGETTATDTAAEAGTEAATDTPAAETSDAVPPATPTPDAETEKAKDVSLKLRAKLASIETELASITSPSRSLVSACNNSKSSLEKRLADLDKQALEVAELQTRFNQISGGEYVFKHVSSDARDKYLRDGQAAYNAMLIDVKEYKNARKVGGLDKFEILRERYQGIPEYKEAYQWYSNTLKDLEKRWTNLLKAEEKKRDRYGSAKRADMQEKDQEAYEKLEAQFEKAGEKIAQVWYNPDKRNLVMLKAATVKVKDALRRNENGLKDEAIGTVPDIQRTFWENMDKAVTLMVSGDLEGAEKTLKDDESFNKLLRLNRNLLPDDYKSPLRAQRQDLDKEIKRRSSERRSLERQLERKISLLERSTSSAEAQIDALLERIAREKEIDTQSSSVELDEKKPAPAKPDAAAPAATDAATPATTEAPAPETKDAPKK